MFSNDYGFDSPIEHIKASILREWADSDANVRYPLLGNCLNMFRWQHHEVTNEASPLFMELLNSAPDKHRFLGHFIERLHPRSWTGSLADLLLARKAQVEKLAEAGDESLRSWIAQAMPQLDSFIENERQREQRREESFE